MGRVPRTNRLDFGGDPFRDRHPDPEFMGKYSGPFFGAGLRHVRRVRPNRAADFRGPPFWTLKILYKLPLIAMLTKEPEMLQPDAFCEHTMQQNATAVRCLQRSPRPTSSGEGRGKGEKRKGGEGKGKGGEEQGGTGGEVDSDAQ